MYSAPTTECTEHQHQKAKTSRLSTDSSYRSEAQELTLKCTEHQPQHRHITDLKHSNLNEDTRICTDVLHRFGALEPIPKCTEHQTQQQLITDLKQQNSRTKSRTSGYHVKNKHRLIPQIWSTKSNIKIQKLKSTRISTYSLQTWSTKCQNLAIQSTRLAYLDHQSTSLRAQIESIGLTHTKNHFRSEETLEQTTPVSLIGWQLRLAEAADHSTETIAAGYLRAKIGFGQDAMIQPAGSLQKNHNEPHILMIILPPLPKGGWGCRQSNIETVSSMLSLYSSSRRMLTTQKRL